MLSIFSQVPYILVLSKNYCSKVQWLLREMHYIIFFSISLSRSWISKDLFILALHLRFSTPIVMPSESLFSIPSSSFLPLFFFLLREQRRVRNANGRMATLWIIVLLKGKVTIGNVIGTLQKWMWKQKDHAPTWPCKPINYNIPVYNIIQFRLTVLIV